MNLERGRSEHQLGQPNCRAVVDVQPGLAIVGSRRGHTATSERARALIRQVRDGASKPGERMRRRPSGDGGLEEAVGLDVLGELVEAHLDGRAVP